MNDLTPEVRKGRKFDQVEEGARRVFLADGFEGASVDDIAKEANVSKATLYSYFPDKQFLFLEICKTECARQAEVALEEIDFSSPPRIVLTKAASRMAEFFYSDFGIKIFRICVAESERFPEIGRQFYDSGPQLARNIMAQYFAKAIERGELQIDDLEMAADQFAELCKASMHSKRVFGILDAVTPQQVDTVVAAAVDTFLARYGV